MRCTTPTATGWGCIFSATDAAKVADDTLTDDEAADAARLACLPAAAAGQCTAAEATLGAAYIAAMPCDVDGTDDATDDCPSMDLSDACGICIWETGEIADISDQAAWAAAEVEAAIAICDPVEADPKLSGSAGLVVSLALAFLSAATTQL